MMFNGKSLLIVVVVTVRVVVRAQNIAMSLFRHTHKQGHTRGEIPGKPRATSPQKQKEGLLLRYSSLPCERTHHGKGRITRHN